jgi:hypothetical protein
MVSLPAGSEDVVIVATPFAIDGVPMRAEPFVKVTVPLAVAGSMAVNVTDCSNVEGFSEDVRVTEGEALFTV